MKIGTMLKFAALATAAVGAFGGLGAAVANTPLTGQIGARTAQTLLAQTFSNREVDQSKFLVLAIPGPSLNPHPLYIVEQVKPSPPCFTEINPGGQPTEINPIWTTFDYQTGPDGLVCRVNKDTNGYGLWLGGVDQGVGWQYKVVESGGELVLQAFKLGQKPVTIGRTYGRTASGYTKIFLKDGWRLTQRVDNASGTNLSFVYFTNDLTLAQLQAAEEGVAVTPTPRPTPTPTPTVTAPFTDIQGDIYAAQIARAAQLGIVAGNEDGTFRPRNTITREEAISMVMEAYYRAAPASQLAQLPQTVYSAPFPDVPANRWSALKILQAKQLGLVKGDYEANRFRPTDTLTRAELMALIAAPITQAPTQAPFTFTDISGHWAADTITRMSAYCGIATPLNEQGTNFAPNMPALRNYTAAALVRYFDCPNRQGGGL